jgi:urea transporter
MVIGLFVPLGLFFMIAVSVGFITRWIATAMLNKTIREALRTDPGSVPLLVEKLEARQPWADALLGWIFLAFAAALAGLALFADHDDQLRMLQAAVIPVVVGITVLLYVHFAQRRSPSA